jgi:hypothetical protein
MCRPPWFNKALKEDVAALVWDRKIEFDPEEEGTTQESKSWIKKTENLYPSPQENERKRRRPGPGPIRLGQPMRGDYRLMVP